MNNFSMIMIHGCLIATASFGAATALSMEFQEPWTSFAVVVGHPTYSAELLVTLCKDKQVIFVTNNARDSRQQLLAKFRKIGDEIFSSAYATAVYLSSVVQFPQSKKVYVIGMSGLEEELKAEGITYAGGTSPEDCTLDPFSLSDFTLDPDVAAVVCGLDTNITYTKLSKAFQYLTRNPGCQFIATNEDKKYPHADGFLPGAGAVSAPLRYALGKDPLCIGKPAATMMDCIRAKVDINLGRTIMVGDQLDTDIAFGRTGGISTLLVLTGGTTESDLGAPGALKVVPDFVMNSLGDFTVTEVGGTN